jgi:hypothetical protein
MESEKQHTHTRWQCNVSSMIIRWIFCNYIGQLTDIPMGPWKYTDDQTSWVEGCIPYFWAQLKYLDREEEDFVTSTVVLFEFI